MLAGEAAVFNTSPLGYDSYVVQLLDEAIYHSEHLRMGLSDHQTGTVG